MADRPRGIRLPDDIWRAVKERADRDGMPANALVEAALRAYLAMPPAESVLASRVAAIERYLWHREEA